MKGRPHNMRQALIDLGFNPRPREGATRQLVFPAQPEMVSIHAPVKGRPHTTGGIWMVSPVSIHAPVKGRPICIRRVITVSGFQSTPP